MAPVVTESTAQANPIAQTRFGLCLLIRGRRVHKLAVGTKTTAAFARKQPAQGPLDWLVLCSHGEHALRSGARFELGKLNRDSRSCTEASNDFHRSIVLLGHIAWCREVNLQGLVNWMQPLEEDGHHFVLLDALLVRDKLFLPVGKVGYICL